MKRTEQELLMHRQFKIQQLRDAETNLKIIKADLEAIEYELNNLNKSEAPRKNNPETQTNLTKHVINSMNQGIPADNLLKHIKEFVEPKTTQEIEDYNKAITLLKRFATGTQCPKCGTYLNKFTARHWKCNHCKIQYDRRTFKNVE